MSVTLCRGQIWICAVFALLILLLGSAVGPAKAQSSPAAFQSGFRWDSQRRPVGRIMPPRDAAQPGGYVFLAERYTYTPDGLLASIERGTLAAWQPEATVPSQWLGFTVREALQYTYDIAGNLIEERKSAGGAVVQVTQSSHDADDRLFCSTVRMNLDALPLPTSNACALGPTGADGPDRVTRTIYDAASQVLKIQQAVGVTNLQRDHVTWTYTENGQRNTLRDGNGNRTTFAYDGFDRLSALRLPSAGDGQVSAPCTLGSIVESGGIAGPSTVRGANDDCEKYSYDRSGNRARLMKRDGRMLGYTFDAIDRLLVKTVPDACVIASPGCTAPPPSATRDVYYGYDRRGLQRYARFDSASGPGVTNAFDQAGRLTSSTTDIAGTARQLGYRYDRNGNRTGLTWPDNSFVEYGHDGLDRLVSMGENGEAAVVSVGYDDQGRRSSLSVGVASNFGYDAASRLTALTHDLVGTARDFAWTEVLYNPAGQLKARTLGSDAYVWVDQGNVNRAYMVNGLNQYARAGVSAITYDANGNLSRQGWRGYGYDAENRLIAANDSGTATLSYDPLGRLSESNGAAGTIRFLYDGDALVAEYDAAGTLLRRYAHGTDTDAPVLWYEGSGFGAATRRLLRADHQGSIVVVADSAGTSLAANAYDPYGIPNLGNLGRFQYTGQIAIPGTDLYHYKARAYSPKLGRFLQTDPVGYDDQFNLYAYVANDPINGTDPTGRQTVVSLRAYPLGEAPVVGKWGHSFVVYTDAKTGESRISRAGPDPAYQRGPAAALANLPQENTNIRSTNTPADRGPDAGVPGTVTIQSVTIPDKFSAVNSNINSLESTIDSSKTPYQPLGPNSNSFAGTIFNEVTGVTPQNNSNITLPGLGTNLIDRIQPPMPECDKCTMPR